jgi:hypothetical protein
MRLLVNDGSLSTEQLTEVAADWFAPFVRTKTRRDRAWFETRPEQVRGRSSPRRG